MVLVLNKRNSDRIKDSLNKGGGIRNEDNYNSIETISSKIHATGKLDSLTVELMGTPR